MNFWVMRHLFRQKEKMASSHKRSSLCDLTRFIYFLQDKERGSRSKLRCISQRWSSFWSWQASPKVMGDSDQSAGTSDRETKRIDPIHKKKRNYLRAKKVYRMNILLLWMFHVFFFIYCDEFWWKHAAVFFFLSQKVGNATGGATQKMGFVRSQGSAGTKNNLRFLCTW